MAANRGRLVAGAIGGALGSVVMKGVVRFCDRNSFGLSSQTDAKAARAIFGEALEQKRAERIGSAIHYGFGVATGIGYAASREAFPALRAGYGTAFGGGLWLIGDEVAVTAARLEDPGAASALSHFSALAAHLLYGFIVEACVSRADS